MSAATKKRRTAGGGTVIDAVRGDPAYVDGKRHVVKPCCDGTGTMSLCLTCRTVLDGAPALKSHTAEGVHVIARLCAKHGPEERQP